MENFEKFTPKHTSERLATAYEEAGENVRASAEKRVLERRIGFSGTTMRQMEAQSDMLNLDQAYRDLQHEIQSEAENYAAGYEQYVARMKQVADAQGLDAKPHKINDFIDKVDDSVGDESQIRFGRDHRFGDTETEFYSFHASPEARERAINREVIKDFLRQPMPVGSFLEAPKGPTTTTIESWQPPKGMEMDAAIAQAKEKGLTSMIRLVERIHDERNKAGVGMKTSTLDTYIPVSKELAALLTDKPAENYLFPDQGKTWKKVYEDPYGTITVSHEMNLFPLSSIEKVRNPIKAVMEIGDRKIDIEEATPEAVIDAAMRSVVSTDFHKSDAENRAATLENFQRARMKLADGPEITLMELNTKALEDARSKKEQAPEAVA